MVDGASVTTTAGTIWWDTTANNYYQCNTICFKTAVDLCGDGFQSNGFTSKSTKEFNIAGEETMDAGLEACDDANRIDGDGCSADC